jgi:hypothetical protein
LSLDVARERKFIEDEMGWLCGTYGGEEKCLLDLGSENLKKRDKLDDLDTDGRILLQ